MLSQEQIRTRFDQLTVWKRGEERAPHKPLLILLAIGHCIRHEPRLIPYAEIDPELRKLLIEFGPTRKSYHPEFPFWYLQNDGIWEITDTSLLERRRGSSNPKKSELLRYDIRGGFIPEIYKAFMQDKAFSIEISRRILEAHFPDSMHEDLLEAVGIEASDYSIVKVRRRDPKFREKILRAYEYSCAICGFDVRIDNFQVALEAAHIKWHQAGGPDIEQNGLALCSLHHKLFDRGAFTLNDKLEISISDHAHGSFGFSEWLMSFHQKPIRSPRNSQFSPQINYIDWHYKEVFKR